MAALKFCSTELTDRGIFIKIFTKHCVIFEHVDALCFQPFFNRHVILTSLRQNFISQSSQVSNMYFMSHYCKMFLIDSTMLYRFETILYIVWNYSFTQMLISFTNACFREITFQQILHYFKHILYSQTNNWLLLPSRLDRIIPAPLKTVVPPTLLRDAKTKKTILHNRSGNFYTIPRG